MEDKALLEKLAVAIGEEICRQLVVERVGEGDKVRAIFILPGKALDFTAAARAALAVIGKEESCR